MAMAATMAVARVGAGDDARTGYGAELELGPGLGRRWG